MPQASAALAGQVTALSRSCAPPSSTRRRVSETLDWVAALVALDREVVDPAIVDTLGVLLKSREDVIAVKGERATALVGRALARA